jgi:hypothetical protein
MAHNPIGVQEGREAQVLVSKAFYAAVTYGSPRMPRDMNGLWDSLGRDFVQGRITHNSSSGIPVAIGAVSIRERLDTYQVLAPPLLGIDPEGWYSLMALGSRIVFPRHGKMSARLNSATANNVPILAGP